MLGVSDRQVRALVDRGRLVTETVARRRLVLLDSVLDYRVRRTPPGGVWSTTTIWAVARTLGAENPAAITGVTDPARIRRYARDLTWDAWRERGARRAVTVVLDDFDEPSDLLSTLPDVRVGGWHSPDSLGRRHIYTTRTGLAGLRARFGGRVSSVGSMVVHVVVGWPASAPPSDVPIALRLLDLVESGAAVPQDEVRRMFGS
jgi:hypothetical protein